MKPALSYTIWFSQRTGSSLLTTALEATGVAGRPHEWLNDPAGVGVLALHEAEDAMELQRALWQRGTTPNGVWGAKISFHEPQMRQTFALLRQLPGCPAGASRPEVWEHAFPNHRHLFMMRRNTVRQAVSWWRAIQSQEWHRPTGTAPEAPPDVEAGYDFDAINHLCAEVLMREAGIQAFFAEAGIVPLTLVYEDFIQDYAGTLRRVLCYLGQEPPETLPAPAFTPLAGEIAEAWVQRFRRERQAGWDYVGW